MLHSERRGLLIENIYWNQIEHIWVSLWNFYLRFIGLVVIEISYQNKKITPSEVFEISWVLFIQMLIYPILRFHAQLWSQVQCFVPVVCVWFKVCLKGCNPRFMNTQILGSRGGMFYNDRTFHGADENVENLPFPILWFLLPCSHFGRRSNR